MKAKVVVYCSADSSSLHFQCSAQPRAEGHPVQRLLMSTRISASSRRR